MCVLFIPVHSLSQESERALIVSYNVENLFDTVDDPITSDEEFLPSGDRRWTRSRFEQKCRHIYQVLAAMANPNFPAIVGLCEIENQYVLDQLLALTPLGRMGYRSIHQESPDRRGIDVALLYRHKNFQPLSYQAIPVVNPSDAAFKTRDILYVKGILFSDTIHFFVNHWPSKYGGAVDTKPLRALAARTLKVAVDSLLKHDPESSVVLMGDFNDSPNDESVAHVLGACSNLDSKEDFIINLFGKETGSNKYQNKWEQIDQIMVGRSMLNSCSSGIKIVDWGVFREPFLLTEDKNYLGKKTFRTYNGFSYEGGFSDHLPIYMIVQHR